MSSFRLVHLLSLLCVLSLAACGDGIPSDTTGTAEGVDTGNSDGLGLASDASATQTCTPEAVVCTAKERFVCAADGATLLKKPCDTGTFCASGTCVQCVADTDCPTGSVCNVEGVCKTDRLTITTDALPAGLVSAPYKVDMAATGGTPP